MADRWDEELSKAERKIRQKTAKGLLKAEQALLKATRQREALEKRQLEREEAALKRETRQERDREREARRQQRRDRDRARRQDREGRRRRRRPAPPAQPAAPVPPVPPASRRSAARGRNRRQLSPEERAYRDARRRANARIGFMTHFIAYVSVLALILVSSHNLRATLIVAASWGIGIAIHYFSAVIAPGLRQRLIEDEVGRSVAQGVTQERRDASTRHERSLEDLSASIAHEIRNPVTAAKNLVQQMGEDPVAPDNIQYANVALEELDRVERSISHLLRYARDEEIHFESFAMADVVQSTLDEFSDRIELLQVELDLQLDTPGRMRGDAERMRRVLVNLVGNALDALEAGNTRAPRLTIMVGENLAGTQVWVRVADNGPGIHPDVIDKIFSPFFTTKDKGTGLGLALSKKVVDAHGGTLEVASNVESGTEMVLGFPKDAEGSV